MQRFLLGRIGDDDTANLLFSWCREYEYSVCQWSNVHSSFIFKLLFLLCAAATCGGCGQPRSCQNRAKATWLTYCQHRRGIGVTRLTAAVRRQSHTLIISRRRRPGRAACVHGRKYRPLHFAVSAELHNFAAAPAGSPHCRPCQATRLPPAIGVRNFMTKAGVLGAQGRNERQDGSYRTPRRVVPNAKTACLASQDGPFGTAEGQLAQTPGPQPVAPSSPHRNKTLQARRAKTQRHNTG